MRAPGRVNLLGEHTDYTGGLVLPIAIDRYVEVEASAYGGGVIHAVSSGMKAEAIAAGPPKRGPHPWFNYVLGVAAALSAPEGFELRISGDLPMGAGLASSAALCVATAYALNRLFGLGATDNGLILAAQRAEHEFAGVQCGIMDQAASAVSVKGHALLVDCRTLEMRPIRMAGAGVVIAVCDTGVKHALAETAYNQRVAEAREGMERLGRGGLHPAPLQARVEHIVNENERVRTGAALLGEDLAAFGELMYASHESLRDRYEVSCRELDVLVDAAHGAGAIGAKMTGAGFGGAVVALVRQAGLEEFRATVTQKYRKSTGRELAILCCRSADGARAS